MLPVDSLPPVTMYSSEWQHDRFLFPCLLSVIVKNPFRPTFMLSPDAELFKKQYKIAPIWVSLHLDLTVGVLFHELYPAKQLSSAEHIDRNESLSPQDFVQALQKIDLEGSLVEGPSDVPALHPPSQCESTCLSSWFTENLYKPEPLDSILMDNGTVSNLHPSSQSPILRSPLPPLLLDFASSEEKPGQSRLIPIPTPTCRRSPDYGYINQFQSHLLRSYPASAIVAPHSTNGSIADSSEVSEPLGPWSGEKYDEIKAAESNQKENAQKNASNLDTHEWASQTLTDSCNAIVDRSSKSEECKDLPRLGLLDSMVPSSSQISIKWMDSDTEACAVTSSFPEHNTRSSTEEFFSSRRGTVLETASIRQPSGRGSSLGRGSDAHKPVGSSVGSSSDSEVEYLFGRSDKWRQCETESHSFGTRPSTGSTNSISDSDRVYTNLPCERIPPLMSEDAVSSEPSDQCRSVFGRINCYLRDVSRLREAGVPFSYDEVVFSSNERFRELKSVPSLSLNQVNAMLDARKRATNRQAAERCRRLKIATRDELAERLSSLRLERQLLVRQVAQARQRKQKAGQSLLIEQRRILSLLRGPDGNQLKSSDWGVHLTQDGEVVVVAVGR